MPNGESRLKRTKTISCHVVFTSLCRQTETTGMHIWHVLALCSGHRQGTLEEIEFSTFLKISPPPLFFFLFKYMYLTS